MQTYCVFLLLWVVWLRPTAVRGAAMLSVSVSVNVDTVQGAASPGKAVASRPGVQEFLQGPAEGQKENILIVLSALFNQENGFVNGLFQAMRVTVFKQTHH